MLAECQFYEFNILKFDDLNPLSLEITMAEDLAEFEGYEQEWEVEEEFENDLDVVVEDEVEMKTEMKPELKRLYQQHPECLLDYIEQVVPKIPLQMIPPGGTKADNNHRTYPFLTIFERTKIIGLRANQISKGSTPFIVVPPHITDVRDIARLELEQKRLPYIIKRPLPNGTFEYWRLMDLLQL
jgi:DNA-directed RNA polymerase I, II, and III subunit RPABC2